MNWAAGAICFGIRQEVSRSADTAGACVCNRAPLLPPRPSWPRLIISAEFASVSDNMQPADGVSCISSAMNVYSLSTYHGENRGGLRDAGI